MTGRARMVNTVFWLSYFVLLCNEVQAQPCLSLNNQNQLLQALGWEEVNTGNSVLHPPMCQAYHSSGTHIPLGYERNILQIGNKQKSFSI